MTANEKSPSMVLLKEGKLNVFLICSVIISLFIYL